jgi:hypothetical protein
MKERLKQAEELHTGTYLGFWQSASHLLGIFDGCRQETELKTLLSNLKSFTNPLDTQNPAMLPFYSKLDPRLYGPVFLIPMTNYSLPKETFLNVAAFPMALVGLPENSDSADNTILSPALFANHDLTHARTVFLKTQRYFSELKNWEEASPSLEYYRKNIENWKKKEQGSLQFLESLKKNSLQAFNIAVDLLFDEIHEGNAMPLVWAEISKQYTYQKYENENWLRENCSQNTTDKVFESFVEELMKPLKENLFQKLFQRNKSKEIEEKQENRAKILVCLSARASQ